MHVQFYWMLLFRFACTFKKIFPMYLSLYVFIYIILCKWVYSVGYCCFVFSVANSFVSRRKKWEAKKPTTTTTYTKKSQYLFAYVLFFFLFFPSFSFSLISFQNLRVFRSVFDFNLCVVVFGAGDSVLFTLQPLAGSGILENKKKELKLLTQFWCAHMCETLFTFKYL